ncbi:MAG TPA: flavodoxin family protein [Flavisolibacter sp.]|jgi:multimeric flavodoxin WrbA|nr:flavodoxin family protein [Flavisolibacter sp.]
MEKGIISIVFHSQQGHTKQVAEILAANMQTELTEVNLVHVEEAAGKIGLLHSSDTIIFGSPTYFGNVSAGFKQFMELTETFWYKQPWKDKLATAFTLSSTCNGDKLNTLSSLALFAAQHSMIWISLGILPRFINDQQTAGQNRMASYLGLMVQCSNGRDVQLPHPGDLLTLELFAQRIVDITLQYKNPKNLQL